MYGYSTQGWRPDPGPAGEPSPALHEAPAAPVGSGPAARTQQQQHQQLVHLLPPPPGHPRQQQTQYDRGGPAPYDGDPYQQQQQATGLAAPAPVDDEDDYWPGGGPRSGLGQQHPHQHAFPPAPEPPPHQHHQQAHHQPYLAYASSSGPSASGYDLALPSPGLPLDSPGGTSTPRARPPLDKPACVSTSTDPPSSDHQYRLAFANLQRKQVELRLAEEHRRAREAELELYRLRELDRQRSLSQASVLTLATSSSSARSSYSSAGVATPYSAYQTPLPPGTAHQAHAQAALLDSLAAAATTPASCSSFSHGLSSVDEDDALPTGSYAPYLGQAAPVPLRSTSVVQQDDGYSRPATHNDALPHSHFGRYASYPAPDDPQAGYYQPQQQYAPPDARRSVPPSQAGWQYPYPSPAVPQPTPPPAAAYPPVVPARLQEAPLAAFPGLSLQGALPSAARPAPDVPLTSRSQPPPSASAPPSSRASTSSSSKPSPASRKSPKQAPPPSSGPSSTAGPSTAPAPAPRRKRLVVQKEPVVCCSECAGPIAFLLLRGDDESFTVPWEGVWVCRACMGDTDVAAEEGIRRRKRTRDTQNLEAPLCCDVCLKLRGRGGILAKDSKSAIAFSTEFVCVSCDEAYQRCTDCGGGGGGRIGVGKWRSKELFASGRKTCFLMHTRIGNAPLTFGVWDSRDLHDAEIRASLLERCESLWRDKLLSRLAIPEVLEVESDPPRSFGTIQAALDEGWPGRAAFFDSADPALNTEGRRRYFGLTWVKSRPRRQTASEQAADAESPQTADSTGAAAEPLNKLNPVDIIPAGHELVGLFVGTWSPADGTLLLTTSLPFESTDGDDRNALAIGEIACRVVAEIAQMNDERTAAFQAGLARGPLTLVPPLEHLFVLCDNADPSIRERMRDLLQRRRGFHLLDEYVQLHPSVDPAIFRVEPEPPTDRPGWIMGGVANEEDCDVMVRWLGTDFGRQKLEEIASSEFSKRLKAKKKTS